jgi:AAA family ATP:ADP antiporter
MNAQRRNPLERFLSLFAEVHAGEGRSTVLLTLAVFLLLTSYYIIKPVREALILAGGGAAVKSYAAAGQAALLLVTVPLYARLAGQLSRRRLLTVVTLFFTACLGGFYLLAQLRVPLGVPFFLWVGIFNYTVIAQFWSLANDLHTPEAGKRLFAILGFGASAGAVFGSWVTEILIEPVGMYQLMLLSAGLLVVSLVLSLLAERRVTAGGAPAPDTGTSPDDPPPEAGLGRDGVFTVMRASRYLQLLALLTLLTNVVNTTGEYLLGELVTRTAREHALAGGATGEAVAAAMGPYIGAFYAGFFKIVNIVGLVTQLFLVSRLVKYLGVKVCLLILPLIAMGGYGLLLAFPVLSVVRWAKTAENATDYSLQNTVRNMLWLPTSRQEKYKAKQFVDTFCVRLGDMLSAGVVFVGTTWLGFGVAGFAGFNLVLVGFWVIVSVVIGRRFVRLVPDHRR